VKRRLLFAGLGLLLVIATAAFWSSAGRRDVQGKFETVRVERGRIAARVTASGTLSALVTVQVGSQVSGRIQELFADFNSPVRRGQVLATMDRRLFEASMEQARANVAAAEGNLARARAQEADAKRQRDRAKALSEQNLLIAQADVDTAQANAEAARAQVEVMEGGVQQARAGLHQAEVNLGYATILSPIDGVVISRNVDVGQTVAASLQAPTLFSIAQDLRKMQVDADVAEADVGRLHPGVGTTFTVDAYPGEPFRGVVRQIRNAPQTLQNVVIYDAVIDVENPDLKLRPGMTANVTIVYASKENVLRIPNAALRFRPSADLLASIRPAGGAVDAAERHQTGRRTVWVLRDGRPRQVVVKTGLSDGVASELVEGEVEEGDQLITDAGGDRTGRQGAPPMFGRGF